MVKTKLKYVIPTFFTCFAEILAAHALKEASCWAGATHDSLWARNHVQKWGRSSPTRCFARGQIGHSVMRKLFSFGHLLDSQSEREGDVYGDLCLSCTRHLPTLRIRSRLLK